MLTLAGSLARGKILAESLGTSGVGIVAQLGNFAALLGGISTLGLATAGVTLIGRTQSDEEAPLRRRIVSTVVAVPIGVSVVLAVLAAAFARPISHALLGSHTHPWYIVLAAASLPANALASAYQVVLQGYGRAWRVAINSAAAAIAGVVIAALLVIPFGLTGGVLTVTASAFAAAVVMLVRERSVTAEALPLASAGRSANRLLLQFGGASLIAGTMTSVVDLVLRSALTTRFGAAANGVYQPAYVLGNLVFVQLGAGIATAITPSLARHWALGEIDRTSVILRTAVRLSLVAMVPLLLIVTAARGIIVPAVFSGAFKGAEPILALQLTTELPRAIAYTLGAFLLPAGMIRAWVIMGVSSEVIRLVVGLLLLNRLHAQALSTASVASWVFIAITTMRLAHGRGIRLGGDTDRLIGAATIVVASSFVATLWRAGTLPANVVIAAIAIGWLFLVPTAAERKRISNKIRQLLHSFRRSTGAT
jgi:O-antigen/teichoic acid export membrane protein